MNEKELREKLKEKGNVVLLDKIDARNAANLRILAGKLNGYDVFIQHKGDDGRIFKHGLTISESSESRDYVYDKLFSPTLGYVQIPDENISTKTKGIKGIEGYFDNELSPGIIGKTKGNRDIANTVLLNGASEFIEKQDGKSIVLSISLRTQIRLEKILDEANQKLNAKEIIATVMDSKTGQIIAMGTTNRFNPSLITRYDLGKLNVSVAEYSFEPGSVIKPLIYALLLENKKIIPEHRINLENGIYKLGTFTIRDSKVMKTGTIEEVLVHSSNIGMAKISNLLETDTYYNGLKKFGLGEISDIGILYEKDGLVPSTSRLQSPIYKASVGYGYGIRTTFIQMLRAYSAIINDGNMVSPYLVDSYTNQNGQTIDINRTPSVNVLPQNIANRVKDVLVKIVKEGTGVGANIEGLSIGGKTGTARIVVNGKYVSVYNSSFFGFAEDGRKSYTIGVSVFEPDTKEEFYASLTAVPVFKEIVNLLTEERYLRKTQ